jgi:hypothetical protein
MIQWCATRILPARSAAMNLTDAQTTHEIKVHRANDQLVEIMLYQQFYSNLEANWLGDQFDRHL